MGKKWEIRDVLLLLILIMLVVNTFLGLPIRKSEAETFRLDSCVTVKPTDKPDAYVHVVSH